MAADGLASSDALRGIRVGISVSDSGDLSRLGLSAAHAEQAVGEVARAVLIAGGSLAYGGRVKPSGLTQYLMHEVRRYGRDHEPALTLCLAAPEHLKLSYPELDDIDRTLGTRGRIVCLDPEGREIEGILSAKSHGPDPIAEADAPQCLQFNAPLHGGYHRHPSSDRWEALRLRRGNAWNPRRGDRCCGG